MSVYLVLSWLNSTLTIWLTSILCINCYIYSQSRDKVNVSLSLSTLYNAQWGIEVRFHLCLNSELNGKSGQNKTVAAFSPGNSHGTNRIGRPL